MTIVSNIGLSAKKASSRELEGTITRTVQTVGASPWVFTNADSNGLLIVQGGTVSQIEYSTDDGSNFDGIGATNGIFPCLNGGQYRITYTVVPVVIYVSR